MVNPNVETPQGQCIRPEEGKQQSLFDIYSIRVNSGNRVRERGGEAAINLCCSLILSPHHPTYPFSFPQCLVDKAGGDGGRFNILMGLATNTRENTLMPLKHTSFQRFCRLVDKCHFNP